MTRINSRINFRIRTLHVFEADFWCCFGACDPKVKRSILSNQFIFSNEFFVSGDKES